MITGIIIIFIVTVVALFLPDEKKTSKSNIRYDKPRFIEENSTKVPKNKLFSYKANRIFSEDFAPVLGDNVRLWKSPLGVINVYAPGSMLGAGLIGELNNKTIALHLQNGFPYSATIIGSEGNKLILEIILEDEFRSIDDLSSFQKTKYLSEIQKRYTPKSSWDIYFILKSVTFDKNNITVKCNPIDSLNLINFEQNIWIEDNSGNIISELNKSETASTIRTMRALYSNCNIRVKFNHDKLGYACFSIIPNQVARKN